MRQAWGSCSLYRCSACAAAAAARQQQSDLPSLPSPPPNTTCSNEPLEHKLLYPNNLAKALVSEVA
jgi:hypothetical protein